MKKRIHFTLITTGFFLMSLPYTALSEMQMSEQALQALPQQDRNKIMDKMAERHIRLMEKQKGLDSLTSTEKDQLAVAMAVQENPLLQKYLGKRDIPIHLMEKMRDQTMTEITSDIISHNQSLCMPIVQPYMSKEVRKRIQVTTIPMFT
ncbi:MAG: hypothetical protein D3908_10365, partial [Candidatus Electrothrix sp. AUS4]|nr:hypothetical protein [Candidatus Electrothrix sp. AUS4]